MSRQNVLKAELKTRRSSRELEQGLDYLAEKVEKGAAIASELKDRVTQVSARITHPKETLQQALSQGAAVISERARALGSSAQDRYRSTPLRSKQIISGIFLASLALLGLIALRRRRAASDQILGVAAEQARRAKLFGTSEEDLVAS